MGKTVKNIILILGMLILGILMWVTPDIKEIAAGVAILLWGMLILEEGFKRFSGGPLENILKKSTSNLFKSISFGIVSTSLLQSSSLITVITISFLSAGLIELAAGIGIILGANIGTTTGAWLIATFGLKLKISAFALPMVVFGIIFYFQKNIKLKGFGGILAGIGFLFLGIHYMKEGFEAYQEAIDVSQFQISGFWGMAVFALLGVAITVIMQSSHATLAIILTALSFNQITYHSALALAIGANVGTTITAIISAAGSNISGKKLATAHLIFNLSTGLVAIGFIKDLANLVDIFSLKLGIETTDYTLKLAMFHTIFNVIGVLIIIPFVGQLVKFLNKVFKEKKSDDISIPKYLNRSVLEYSETAIPALINESRHMFDNAFEIIAHGTNLHRRDILSNKKLKELVPRSIGNMRVDIDRLYLNKIKSIYSKIIHYATIVQGMELKEDEVTLVQDLKISVRFIVQVIKNLETIQENMAQYMGSKNQNLRTEYNTLRLKIAKVLREIYNIESCKDINLQYEKLEKLKRKARLHDVLVNGSVDHLIRENLIKREEATSLMNDSAIVARVCEKLIEVAELLYINTDSILSETDKEKSNNNLRETLLEE